MFRTPTPLADACPNRAHCRIAASVVDPSHSDPVHPSPGRTRGYRHGGPLPDRLAAVRGDLAAPHRGPKPARQPAAVARPVKADRSGAPAFRPAAALTLRAGPRRGVGIGLRPDQEETSP